MSAAQKLAGHFRGDKNLKVTSFMYFVSLDGLRSNLILRLIRQSESNGLPRGYDTSNLTFFSLFL